MRLYELQYYDDRIEEILRGLRKSNSRYSAACQDEGEVFARIKNIMDKQSEIFIADDERARITELMERQEQVEPIIMRELYRQGYLDHMRLTMSLVR